MPTSSQSLILQTSHGHLPPFFGRRYWKPDIPPGLEETSALDYPVSVVQVKPGFIGNEVKGTKTRRIPRLYKSGSAPDLLKRADVSFLPQLLSVRGLHGFVRYDNDLKSMNWKVNTIGPFYERRDTARRASHDPVPFRMRYYHGDRGHFSTTKRLSVDNPEAMEQLYQSNYGRKVRFSDSHLYPMSLQSRAENERLMTWNEHDREMNLIRAHFENADCYKLVEVDKGVTNNTDVRLNKTPRFKLEKCRPTDTCSFRLSSTEAGEDGDFKILAPQGFVLENYRLVTSSEMDGTFVLLQSDDEKSGQYKPVETGLEQGNCRYLEKSLEQGLADINNSVRDSRLHNYRMNVRMPNEARGMEDVRDDPTSNYAGQSDAVHKHTGTFASTENRYNYFDDVRGLYTHVENENLLPDSSLYERGEHDFIQQVSEANHGSDRSIRDGMRYFDQHLREFNQRYTETLRAPMTYGNPAYREPRMAKEGDGANAIGNNVKRTLHTEGPNQHRGALSDIDETREALEQYGVNSDRAAYPGHNLAYTNLAAGKSSIPSNNNWKTHGFDQWSRTTNLPKDNLLSTTISYDTLGNVQNVSPTNLEGNVSTVEDDEYIIDEVKFKADCKQWRKKKIATVRMRKELPPEDPTAVCIRCADTSLSHTDLKSIIEKQTGHKVVSLQFDPVSVHVFDTEATSRWIIKLEDLDIAEQVVATGIRLNDVRCPVRKYDDVVKEEHEAYKFYEMVKKLTGKKTQKSTTVQKHILKPITLKTTQTQTKKQH